MKPFFTNTQIGLIMIGVGLFVAIYQYEHRLWQTAVGIIQVLAGILLVKGKP